MKNKKKQALRLLFIAFITLPTLLISQDKEALNPPLNGMLPVKYGPGILI